MEKINCVLNRPTCKKTIMNAKGPYLDERCPLTIKPKCMLQQERCPLVDDNNEDCTMNKIKEISRAGGCFSQCPPSCCSPPPGCCPLAPSCPPPGCCPPPPCCPPPGCCQPPSCCPPPICCPCGSPQPPCCCCNTGPQYEPAAECRMENEVKLPPCNRCGKGRKPKGDGAELVSVQSRDKIGIPNSGTRERKPSAQMDCNERPAGFEDEPSDKQRSLAKRKFVGVVCKETRRSSGLGKNFVRSRIEGIKDERRMSNEPKDKTMLQMRNKKTVPDCTLSSRRPFPCAECLIDLLDCPLTQTDYDSSKVYCKARAVKCPFTQVVDMCDDECLCDNIPPIDLGPDCPFGPRPCPCCSTPQCPLTKIPPCPLVERTSTRVQEKPKCRCFCPTVPNPCSITCPRCPMHSGGQNVCCPARLPCGPPICPATVPRICCCSPQRKKKKRKCCTCDPNTQMAMTNGPANVNLPDIGQVPIITEEKPLLPTHRKRRSTLELGQRSLSPKKRVSASNDMAQGPLLPKKRVSASNDIAQGPLPPKKRVSASNDVAQGPLAPVKPPAEVAPVPLPAPTTTPVPIKLPSPPKGVIKPIDISYSETTPTVSTTVSKKRKTKTNGGVKLVEQPGANSRATILTHRERSVSTFSNVDWAVRVEEEAEEEEQKREKEREKLREIAMAEKKKSMSQDPRHHGKTVNQRHLGKAVRTIPCVDICKIMSLSTEMEESRLSTHPFKKTRSKFHELPKSKSRHYPKLVNDRLYKASNESSLCTDKLNTKSDEATTRTESLKSVMVKMLPPATILPESGVRVRRKMDAPKMCKAACARCNCRSKSNLNPPMETEEGCGAAEALFAEKISKKLTEPSYKFLDELFVEEIVEAIPVPVEYEKCPCEGQKKICSCGDSCTLPKKECPCGSKCPSRIALPKIERTFHVPTCAKAVNLFMPKSPVEGEMVCPFTPNPCPLGPLCAFPIPTIYDPSAPEIPKPDVICLCKPPVRCALDLRSQKLDCPLNSIKPLTMIKNPVMCVCSSKRCPLGGGIKCPVPSICPSGRNDCVCKSVSPCSPSSEPACPFQTCPCTPGCGLNSGKDCLLAANKQDCPLEPLPIPAAPAFDVCPCNSCQCPPPPPPRPRLCSCCAKCLPPPHQTPVPSNVFSGSVQLQSKKMRLHQDAQNIILPNVPSDSKAYQEDVQLIAKYKDPVNLPSAQRQVFVPPICTSPKKKECQCCPCKKKSRCPLGIEDCPCLDLVLTNNCPINAIQCPMQRLVPRRPEGLPKPKVFPPAASEATAQSLEQNQIGPKRRKSKSVSIAPEANIIIPEIGLIEEAKKSSKTTAKNEVENSATNETDISGSESKRSLLRPAVFKTHLEIERSPTPEDELETWQKERCKNRKKSGVSCRSRRKSASKIIESEENLAGESNVDSSALSLVKNEEPSEHEINKQGTTTERKTKSSEPRRSRSSIDSNKVKLKSNTTRLSFQKPLSPEVEKPNTTLKPVAVPKGFKSPAKPSCILAGPTCPYEGTKPPSFYFADNTEPKKRAKEEKKTAPESDCLVQKLMDRKSEPLKCPIQSPPCDLFPGGRCPMKQLGTCDCNYPVAPCMLPAQCGNVVAPPQYCYKEDCCMGLPLPPIYDDTEYETGTYYKFMDWFPGVETTKHYIDILDYPPEMNYFKGHEKRVHDNWSILRAGTGYEQCKKVQEIIKARGPVGHRGSQFDERDNPLDEETLIVIENKKNRDQLTKQAELQLRMQNPYDY